MPLMLRLGAMKKGRASARRFRVIARVHDGRSWGRRSPATAALRGLGANDSPSFLDTAKNLLSTGIQWNADRTARKEAEREASRASALAKLQQERSKAEQELAIKASEIRRGQSEAEASAAKSMASATTSKYLMIGGIAVAALGALYLVTRK